MTPLGWDESLRRVLARYPAIARPSAAPETLGNAGGLSGALLWRFTSGRGLLTARAWPPEGPSRTLLEGIHRWIALAGRAGFVPVPIPALDGRSVQEEAGRLWEVAPWLPGQPPGPEAPERTVVRAAFAALGAVHQALQSEGQTGPSPGLRERVGTIEWWLATGFAALETALNHSATDPLVAPARRWLADARRAAPRWLAPLRDAAGVSVWCQPCLRDVRPEHFLFTGERVTGLVDYGAMAIDCVAGDIARLLSEWLGDDGPLRAEALSAYAAIRSLDERETQLIEAFEFSAALLGAGRWASWHFLEGRAFRDPGAVAEGLRKGAERLARRLAATVA